MSVDPQRPRIAVPGSPYAAFDVVAMAASTGGLRAYSQLLAALPSNFPAAVILVQHRTPRHQHLLVDLLSRRSALPTREAAAADRLRGGTVYVAPSDQQLVVHPDGTLTVSPPPAGGLWRCAADPLFESVAVAFGERAIGVVLTGELSDGAAGVQAIKRTGGRVLIQDQATAECWSMPRASIATGCVDFVLPLQTITAALVALVMAPGAATLLRVPTAPWARLTAPLSRS